MGKNTYPTRASTRKRKGKVPEVEEVEVEVAVAVPDADEEVEKSCVEEVEVEVAVAVPDADEEVEKSCVEGLIEKRDEMKNDVDEVKITSVKGRKRIFEETPDEPDTFHGIGPTSTRIMQMQLEDSETEDEEEYDREHVIDSFDNTLYDMLRDFLECAFTSLAYKLGLQPKDEFKEKRHPDFEQVQVFCNEESQQYVQEVSKSAVKFIRKGVLDGVVFHVNMLNNKNCPITQQRYLFRPRGMFCAEDFDMKDFTRLVKTIRMCKTQLLQMLKNVSGSPVEKLKCPWYSQWSITLGLKKEFINLLRENGHTGPEDPFMGDTAIDYFPWKKRPRLSQAVKLGLVNPLPKDPNGKILPGVISRVLDSKKKAETEKYEKLKAPAEQTQGHNSSKPGVSNSILNSTKKAETEKFANLKALEQPYNSSKPNLSKLPEWEYFTSSSDSDDELQPPSSKLSKTIPKQKLLIKPISSQEVLPKLMILIYRIDYTNNTVVVNDAMIRAAEKDRLAHEKLLKFSD